MKPTTETCECKFPSKEEERGARRLFLLTEGDEIPENVVAKMVADKFWGNWVTKCDCQRPSEIVAAAHFEPVDWFLCNVKGLAVSKDRRGQGIGRETTKEVVEKAFNHRDCLVLGADITYDNAPSLKSFFRQGFQTVGEFCWQEGQKPADIVHLIKHQPTQNKTCLEPKKT